MSDEDFESARIGCIKAALFQKIYPDLMPGVKALQPILVLKRTQRLMTLYELTLFERSTALLLTNDWPLQGTLATLPWWKQRKYRGTLVRVFKCIGTTTPSWISLLLCAISALNMNSASLVAPKSGEISDSNI